MWKTLYWICIVKVANPLNKTSPPSNLLPKALQLCKPSSRRWRCNTLIFTRITLRSYPLLWHHQHPHPITDVRDYYDATHGRLDGPRHTQFISIAEPFEKPSRFRLGVAQSTQYCDKLQIISFRNIAFRYPISEEIRSTRPSPPMPSRPNS